jgi:hypothetical protein
VRSEAGRLDVLVNSIWGADPMINWEQRFWEVDLAEIRAYLDQTLVSHVITNRHLAPLMVEADRGLIVGVIDGHFAGYRGHILYDLAKASLARLAYGMAVELAQTGVVALSLSPGFLRSEAVLDHLGVREEKWRDAIAKDPYFAESETPWLVGRAVAVLAADPNVRRKAGLIHFASDLARDYGFTDIDGRVPDFPSMLDAKVKEIASAPPMDESGRFLVWARYWQIQLDPARRELACLLAKALGLEGLGPGLAQALKARIAGARPPFRINHEEDQVNQCLERLRNWNRPAPNRSEHSCQGEASRDGRRRCQRCTGSRDGRPPSAPERTWPWKPGTSCWCEAIPETCRESSPSAAPPIARWCRTSGGRPVTTSSPTRSPPASSLHGASCCRGSGADVPEYRGRCHQRSTAPPRAVVEHEAAIVTTAE